MPRKQLERSRQNSNMPQKCLEVDPEMMFDNPEFLEDDLEKIEDHLEIMVDDLKLMVEYQICLENIMIWH
jgi:hypothetical protein